MQIAYTSTVNNDVTLIFVSSLNEDALVNKRPVRSDTSREKKLKLKKSKYSGIRADTPFRRENLHSPRKAIPGIKVQKEINDVSS